MMFIDESDSTLTIHSKAGKPETSKRQNVKAPLTQERVMVACIERAWIRYYNNRLIVAKTAREFMAVMGNRITSYSEFIKVIDTHDSVIVVINGNPANPLSGHSCFFTKGRYYELTKYNVIDIEQEESKIYHSTRAHQYTNKFGTEMLVHAVIEHREHIFQDEQFIGKYSHLVNKGIVFSINDEFKKYFIESFKTERANFCAQPYSYGIGYNCNTFVFNVLRLMIYRKIRHIPIFNEGI